MEWDQIANVVRSQIVANKDPVEAVRQCVHILIIAAGVNGIAQFSQHLRMYVDIYMPDCPFEITTTNRYKDIDESSISARCNIGAYREIKYLVGTQVVIDEELERALTSTENDFSLIISSRRNTCSLLLGPARFVNHDCDANAQLDVTCYKKIRIIAVKPINIGDEITISYGNDYFGESNKECRCHTCERAGKNGWRTKILEHNDRTNTSQRATRSMSRAEVSRHSTTINSDGARKYAKTISEARVRNRHLLLYRLPWPVRK